MRVTTKAATINGICVIIGSIIGAIIALR